MKARLIYEKVAERAAIHNEDNNSETRYTYEDFDFSEPVEIEHWWESIYKCWQESTETLSYLPLSCLILIGD